MTIDTVLLHRALVDPADAAYLALRLDIDRRGADRADSIALNLWRAVVPTLRLAQDYATRTAALSAVGWGEAVKNAAALPDYLCEAAGATADLVAIWNAGGGTKWRYPTAVIAGAPVARNSSRRMTVP